MTGDANGLNWLEYKTMSAKWDDWRDRFLAHYKLDEKQLGRFNRMLDGQDAFSVGLEKLPPDFDLDAGAKSAGVAKDTLKYDAKSKMLAVDGKLHLLPTEHAKLLEVIAQAKAASSDQQPFANLANALDELAKLSSRLSYRERLAAMLNADPEHVGVKLKGKKDGDDELVVMVSPLNYYKNLIDRYEANYARA